MGNIKSKTHNKIYNAKVHVEVVFQKEGKTESFTPELINRKVNGEARFSYFRIPTKMKILVDKNYPYYVYLYINNKSIDEEFSFLENYRTNDVNYSITINCIDNYRWLDYSPKKIPYFKIRHNRSLEPCEIIVNESRL